MDPEAIAGTIVRFLRGGTEDPTESMSHEESTALEIIMVSKCRFVIEYMEISLKKL